MFGKNEPIKPVYYTRSNGELIDVDLMDEKHVRNAFKKLLRNINKAVNDDGSIVKPKIKNELWK